MEYRSILILIAHCYHSNVQWPNYFSIIPPIGATHVGIVFFVFLSFLNS